MLRHHIFSLFIAAGLCAASTNAASLDGTWGAERTSADGNITHTYFTLHQDGAQLTGKVTANYRNSEIREGKVEGSHFSFVEQFGGNSGRRVQWEGEIVGNELHLRSHPPAGRPPMEMTAKPTDPKAAAPPPKLPLPALKELPSNQLAKLPPMGWNSWNKFRGEVDDKTIREVADAIARNGMKNAGYLYVNIDDTWQGQRDAQGKIHTNKKFPDMKALADFVHGKGLLLGIYSSPGPTTCAGYEGSYGHEQQDAETYSDWGIDYLKYDWCSASSIYDDSEMQAVYQKMGEALRRDRGRLFIACVNTGVRRCGPGDPRSAVIFGERRAISRTNGSRCPPSDLGRRI